MLRDALKSNWRVLLASSVICACLSVTCLLKGEDTAYYGPASTGSFGTRGVSAFTYYFVWPEEDRQEVAQNEEFVAILSAMAGDLPASDLHDRMLRNLILAIVFGAASAASAIALWVAGIPFGNGR
jgi:hypothetical protein